MLTKRQWTIFIFFIIELIFTLFMVAYSGDLSFLTGNLSTLLFLAALYLEKNERSRTILLLSAVWIIVYGAIGAANILASMFAAGDSAFLIDLVISLSMLAAVFMFSTNYYQSNFRSKERNLGIYVLLLPSIAIGIFNLVTYFNFIFSPNILVVIMFIFEMLSALTLPLAMLIYTWMRERRIE